MKRLLMLSSCLLLSCLLGLASAQTLTVWSTGSDQDVEILNAAVANFKESHPDVTVNIQAISWDDAHAKILSAAVSGTGPDMITGGLSWGIEFGELGGMLDLNEVAPDVVSMIAEAAQSGIYDSVVATDGAVYGVPLDLTVAMMVYRPDLLEAVGAASPPETWDELTDALDKLGNKGFALAWGNTDWLGYFNFLYQAGGTLYNEGCTEATINSPEGVEAATFFANLYQTYNAPRDASLDLETGLENGDYAIGYQGNWVLNLDVGRPELAEQVAFAPLAAGPSGEDTAFIGGRIIGIMANSENPELSAEFIASFYDPEVAQAMTDKADEIGSFWIPPVTSFAEQINAPANITEPLIAQLESAKGPPNCPGWEEAASTVTQQLQEIIFNSADPQAALDIAAEEMNSKLN